VFARARRLINERRVDGRNITRHHALQHALERPQLTAGVIGLVERRPLVTHEDDRLHHWAVPHDLVQPSQRLMREQLREAKEMVQRNEPHRELHLDSPSGRLQSRQQGQGRTRAAFFAT
jgi:hypothetical protein